MTALQFNCPHCDGVFQTLRSLAGQAVACPHCSLTVQLPDTEAGEPGAADDSSDQPAAVLAAAEQSAPSAPAPLAAEESRMWQEAEPLTREQRASRKLMKNLILWVVCAIVLLIVLWFLLVRGPLSAYPASSRPIAKICSASST